MDNDFDYYDEPAGSCENCGCNLYEWDDEYLCSQCEWWVVVNSGFYR